MANMIKNISKNTVKANSNFHVREDLNFSDDGNRFRGFDYKGLPITTLRADDRTYLSVRWDYMDNDFTVKEWMQTEESMLADEFNGCDAVDLDKLIDNCERIIKKIAELNEKASGEVIDMTDVKDRVKEHIQKIDAAFMSAKNINWWELDKYRMGWVAESMRSLIKERNMLENTDFDMLPNYSKKQWKERACGEHAYLPGQWDIKRIKEYIG